jgi:maleamate amidohydrolase
MTGPAEPDWREQAKAFDKFAKGRTGFGKNLALLVIDMQKEYADPGCAWSFEMAAPAAKNIQPLLHLVRRKGIPVIYTYNGFRADLTDAGLMAVKSVDLAERRACQEGTDGVKIIESIAPEPGDYVINKKRFSAFFGTDLEVVLRGLGVDTVIVTGCVTSGCVRMTAYDAFQRDFRVVIPAECVGDQTKALHEQTLFVMDVVVADVMPLKEVMAYLAKLPPRKPNAVALAE